MNNLYRNYHQNSEWVVGGLFSHDGFIMKLHDKCMELGLKKPISYVFGGIPCKWHGGRLAPRTATLYDALEIIDEMNKRGIGCRFTFSSYNITEKDLKDELCNNILNHLAKNKLNGIIVSSDILRDYAKEKYPDLTVIASVVKASIECKEDNPDYYNGLIERYDIVVIKPYLAKDKEFLKRLSDISKVEILANHRCVQNCPIAGHHYQTQDKLEKAIIAGNINLINHYKDDLEEINKLCIKHKNANPLDISILSADEIEELSNLGIKYFKLEGRDYEGFTFIRDLGTWIFNPDGPYIGLTHVIQGGPI